MPNFIQTHAACFRISVREYLLNALRSLVSFGDMKTLFLALLALLPSFAQAAKRQIPDIPPDVDGAFYRRYMEQNQMGVHLFDALDPIMVAGERNLDWLKHMNSFRPEGQKLSFTSKETQRGIPIESPMEYNASIALTNFANLKASMPEALSKVIFSGADFTRDPPIETTEYLTQGRLLDRVYQTATRWRMMQSWLPYLAQRRSNEIRGYYFLSRMENRAEKLRGYKDLPAEEQTKIRDYLVSVCLNDGTSLSRCRAKVNELAKSGDMEAFYQSKRVKAAEKFASYFRIPSYAARNDFSLKNNGKLFYAPFRDPGTEEVRRFLQDNIQEEWRFGDWHLELPFTADAAPNVVFEEGVVPHVNGLGGDTITMNASQPLTEYDAQWTIRHEFGHVLGLPDCYIEYYDNEREVIVNYQIDVDNIMCSRKGHVKEVNVTELLRAYSR